MGKPFDLNDLVARLKARGLTAAEQVLKIVAGETIDWVSESCLASSNALVKFAGPVVAGLKPIAIGEIDKLDGIAGN